MLPKSTSTPTLKALKDKLDAVTGKEISTWPQVTRDDVVLVGCVMVLYSYIDLDIRRIVEAADNAGALGPPWAGKTARLTMSDAEKVVRSLPDWSAPNNVALDRVQDLRGLRNLVAHFAIRRFPDDDAFVMITKSAADYKRAFGTDPPAGGVMTAIVEVQQVKDAVKEIQRLHTWLATATMQIEGIFEQKKSQGFGHP